MGGATAATTETTRETGAMATSATAASATLETSAVATSAAGISAVATSAAGATSSPTSRLGQVLPARHLPLHDLADQADDPVVARHPQVTALVGLRPVSELALGRELVELRPADRDVHAGVGGRILRDLRTRQLHAPDRHVSAACPQLQAQHQLELPQRRHLGCEPLECLRDQRPRVLRAHCR